MTKVISFKTSDENYDRLKKSGKTFRGVLEPLLIDFFNKERSIPHCIPKETENRYQQACKEVDEFFEAENDNRD